MNMTDFLWWQEGVIYQIYPRSFQDSNQDGIGDLQGIIQRLDYLQFLGVSAIWISPIYPSPMADFGYDVADYTGIHPMFGNMEDFDELLLKAHQKGLRVILDLVPNHSSDQHPWFLESKSSKNNPKRDWYIWKDPSPDGKEPNNWMSVFGGSGWEFDETTGQYYYHGFLKEQPDLNWRNPEVQDAMLGVMDFWFKKGVDGFRIDVIWHMVKDDLFRNNPINPDFHEGMSTYNQVLPVYSTDQPEVHAIIARMRNLSDKYKEKLLIGEIYLPVSQLVAYYGIDQSEVHLPFNFQLIVLPWNAVSIWAAINEYEASIPSDGWPNWVLGNHDNSRIASRIGHAQAKIAAMLLLTLRGTPTIYYGDEIGMEDVYIPEDKVQDPQQINMPWVNGRDPERTPMQWDSSKNAGFTTAEPWLPIANNAQYCNVEIQKNDPGSFLSFYRKLINLRQNEMALKVGDFIPVHGDYSIIAFERKYKESKFLILLNLSNHYAHFYHPYSLCGKIEVSTHDKEGADFNGHWYVRPDEGMVIRIC